MASKSRKLSVFPVVTLVLSVFADAEEPVYVQWTKMEWHNDSNMSRSFDTASLWSPEVTPTNSPNNYLCWASPDNPGLMINNWIKWPGGDVVIWGVANSSYMQVFQVQSGDGKYYYMYDAANSPAGWYVNVGRSGFATRGPETLTLDRVIVARQTTMFPTNASHTIEVKRPMGQMSIDKRGPGKLKLDQPFRGGVLHNGGTVELGHPAKIVSGPAGTPFFRFDAAATDTMTTEKDAAGFDCVKRWNDAGGGSMSVSGPKSNGGYTWACPRLGPETVNGVRLVNFGAYSEKQVYPNDDEDRFGPSAELDYSAYKSACEVFFVAKRTTPGYMHTPFEWWTSAGTDGKGAFHLNGNGIGVMNTNGPLCHEADARINGAPVYSNSNFADYFNPDTLQVFHIISTNNISIWHCGGTLGTYAAGGLVLAEAIAYTNNLTEAERAQTTRYLMEKWHEKGKTSLEYRDLDRLELLSEGATVNVPEGREAVVKTVHPPKSASSRNFVKTGAGTLVLDRTETAGVEVREGTVKFAQGVVKAYADPKPAANPHFWGDATKSGRFLFETDAEGNTTSNIVAWLDCRDGVAVTMTNNYIKATKAPFYNANGPRGLPCVDFGGTFSDDGARLGLSTCLNANGAVTYTVKLMEGFIVWRNRAGKDATPRIFSDYAAVSFGRNSSSLCTWGGESDTTQSSAHWSVDGRYVCATNESYGIGVDDWVVIRFSSSVPCYGNSLAGYRNGNGGGIQVGEYLFYDHTLTDAERRETEAYLLKKWKGQPHPDEGTDTFGALSFSGDAEPILDVEGERDFAAIETEAQLVKTGSGTANVTGLSVIETAGVDVREGALEVSFEKDVRPLLKTAYYHFDPSDLSSMVTVTNDGVVTVTRMNHATGNAQGGYATAPYTASQVTVTNLPRLVTETIGGAEKSVIDFGDYTGALSTNVYGVYEVTTDAGAFKPNNGWLSAKEIYLVVKDTDPQKRKSLYGSWEYFADRGAEGKMFLGNQAHAVFTDYWLDVDGVTKTCTDTLPDGWHVVSLSSASDGVAIVNFGAQVINGTLRMGGHRIGEYIVFKDQNDEATRLQIRDYLRKKWLGETDPKTRQLGPLSVGPGATLKLTSDGYDTAYQAAALAGGGTFDLGGLPVVGIAALSASVAADGSVSCGQTTSAVTFADAVTVTVDVAGPKALKVGQYPIFTAAGGLGNAESLAGWTLEFRTPIRNPAHLVKEGNSIVLDVQRRGLSIVVR